MLVADQGEPSISGLPDEPIPTGSRGIVAHRKGEAGLLEAIREVAPPDHRESGASAAEARRSARKRACQAAGTTRSRTADRAYSSSCPFPSRPTATASGEL